MYLDEKQIQKDQKSTRYQIRPYLVSWIGNTHYPPERANISRQCIAHPVECFHGAKVITTFVT